MKTVLGLAFFATFLSGCSAIPMQNTDLRPLQAQQIIQNWPEYARVTAAKFIDEYGLPDRAEIGRLTWINNRLWLKTEVRDSAIQDDTIVQTVAYHVPNDKRAVLSNFSDRLKVSQDGNELSASCANEEENIVMINLAFEMIQSGMQPDEARNRFARAKNLRGSGKVDPLAEGLRFPPEP